MVKKFSILIGICILISLFLGVLNVDAYPLAQLPTVSIPTVTGTPSGVIITVRPSQNDDFINVRSGPSTLFPAVGVLLVGQTAPALGRSPGGEWIQIEYPGVTGGKGWVFTVLVSVSPGELSIVEPPPTVTPQFTATIDPTLAAQFIVTQQPTRFPTYTEPAPLVIPTYVESTPNQLPGGIPMGMVIVVLGITGILLTLFSFIRVR
ncbi:MAG: SH3 domain-containing protein [Anaerolineaceae bacterium]|nr:SH3 domain-containing protein [Anaerolineaceae bacterium]